ncbi:MAG: Lpp/OprI family alanine-zipper lipoprotein [Spongiibacteraceae bacterium]|jgi:uncharacterized lipoprotein NlpE involved in copper resistance
MKHILKLATVLFVVVAAGCANNSQMDETKALAEQAQRSAAAANEAAANAQRTADQAAKAAKAAQSTADSALNSADQANEKVDRAFKKAMEK